LINLASLKKRKACWYGCIALNWCAAMILDIQKKKRGGGRNKGKDLFQAKGML
jgi:hypothetical protein